MSTRSAILGALARFMMPDATGDIELMQSPAQFDASKKIATTQFAMGIGLRIGAEQGMTASGSIPASWAGCLVGLSSSTGPITATLPLAANVPAGTAFLIQNFSPYVNTVQRAGSDLLSVTGANIASVLINNGDTVVAISNGVGMWAISGTAAMRYGASFTLGGAYQKLPSGLLIQWGGGTIPSTGGLSVAFPIAFTVGAYALSVMPAFAGPSTVTLGGDIMAASYANFFAANSTNGAASALSFQYIAIGV